MQFNNNFKNCSNIKWFSGVVDFPVYSNEDYWQREVPYAIFILIFCTFFIILQFLVMRVMITDKDLKKLSAFQVSNIIHDLFL